MNEKRAKRLRRQAEEQAAGFPSVAYEFKKHRTPRGNRYQMLLANSIRRHYKLLKQGRISAWN